MTIADFIEQNDLEHSLLIGYYGGGNFGDELLLETLQLLMQQRGVRQLEVCYQQTATDFQTFHHDFDYRRIPISDKKQFLAAIRRNQTLIIGGGGLWGLDMNNNVFLLSTLLFLSRWFLRKKVFLIGVGYYSSTSRLGHIAAWLAGKSATHIIARDDETAANFRRVSKQVSQDRDIAWQLQKLDKHSLESYQTETNQLSRRLPVADKTLFIAIRRFRPNQRNNYNELIAGFLDSNANTNASINAKTGQSNEPKNSTTRSIIVSLMEPRSVDPEGYALLETWQQRYPAITIADFSYNPVALYQWITRHAENLAFIVPQFHLIVAAQMAGASYLPIAYDNKVAELLQQAGQTPVPLKDLDGATLQLFADSFFDSTQPHSAPATLLSSSNSALGQAAAKTKGGAV
jgi:polysaccharide pyruvyl transferase WcaK-like protein